MSMLGQAILNLNSSSCPWFSTGVDENRSLVITAKNGQEWMALFDICEVELLGLSATTWMEQRQ